MPPLSAKRPRKRNRWTFYLQIFLGAAIAILVIVQWTALNASATGNASGSSISRLEERVVDESLSRRGKSDIQTKITTDIVTNVPSSFPTWLRDYIQWHAEQKKRLSPGTWNATGNRYLVMTCLRDEYACGGLSDRLQHIPTMLHMAAKTNRMFLIYWQSPTALEEFLVPRQTNIDGLASLGLDWTVPQWMVPLLFPPPESKDAGCTFIQKVRTIAEVDSKKTNQPMVCTRTTMHRHGQGLYDDWRQEGEATFIDIYHDIWRFLFEPSRPIAEILSSEMERMHLQPGNYIMAHVRALYAVHDREDNFVQDLTKNAIQCALKLAPRLISSREGVSRVPIFFASDSSLAVETALEYGNGTVVSASKSNDKPLLHLDRANSTDPADYYNIFVDLLLLGNSRCATFNIGGFGRWGALIAYPLKNSRDRAVQSGNTDKEEDALEALCWIQHHKHNCFVEAP